MRAAFLAITALSALMAAASARADLRNPDFMDVTPRLAFAGVERHPDHVFLMHVVDTPSVFTTERVIPIPGPKPFEPGFERRIRSVTILVISKAEYEKLDEKQRRELSPDSPGVLACEIPPPETSRHIRDPDPGVQHYRVKITDGTLSVERDPATPRESSSIWPGRNRIGWGIALAACISWLGLVLGRRLGRRAA